MVKIEIDSTEIDVFSGTSNRTGKPFSMRKQAAWVHLPGDRYPTRIEMTLDDDSQAYPKGEYKLGPRSLFVDRFGRLSLGRLELVTLKLAAAA